MGMEWRDIETAPKDGSDILIFHLGEVHVASWQPVWHPDNKKWVVRQPRAHQDDGNRSINDLGPDYEPDGSLSRWSRPGPTHWIPLPAPPCSETGITITGISIHKTELSQEGIKGIATREVEEE